MDLGLLALYGGKLFQTWALKSVIHLLDTRKVFPLSELCESLENISEFTATKHIRNGHS